MQGHGTDCRKKKRKVTWVDRLLPSRVVRRGKSATFTGERNWVIAEGKNQKELGKVGHGRAASPRKAG